MRDFTWIDGERLIRFARGAADEAPSLLAQRGFDGFALLTTERAALQAPALAGAAGSVLHVPDGPVPEAAAAVRSEVGGRPLVALGGGRVIDVAKGLSGADGLACAAVPTTLSGAPMTRFHRMPAGVDDWRLVRPSLVLADPDLAASQPPEPRAASAMNALAHAAEALYGPVANPVSELAALRAASRLAHGLESRDEADARLALALGAILAGYAVGSAGFALHHVVGQTLVRVTGAPHARAYAVLLPHTLRAMVPRAPEQLAQLAEALGAERRAEAAPDRVAELAALSGATALSDLGVRADQVDAIVGAVLERPDLVNTPDPPDAAELRRLIEAAL
ncbi:MAG: maleylacetate reductase [Actinobacteria bacterium]|nr:MAG: maleylacetate reductase [Actinomycetota bacterium]